MDIKTQKDIEYNKKLTGESYEGNNFYVVKYVQNGKLLFVFVVMRVMSI